MKCNKNYDLLGFLNNEVTDVEKLEINRHISECSDCLCELADVRNIIADLRRVKLIEPKPDFTRRVLQAALKDSPAQATIEISSESESIWGVIKYCFKRSPPWAYSTALHAVIFALLALVFVSQAHKKPLVNENTVNWTQLSLPKMDWSSESVQNVQLTPEPGVFRELISRTELISKIRQGDDQLVRKLIQRADQSKREDLLAQYGGQGTEATVADGMKWLAQTQESTGNWTPSKYGGRDDYTAGLTGLATLCYTGQGNSHLSGAYAGTVDKAVRYLISIQQSDGQINTPHTHPNMYNHSIATYALLEDYLLAQDYAEQFQDSDFLSELLSESLAKAIAFIINAQSADGGWGDNIRSRSSNTAITVWQIQVLRLASVFDIEGLDEALAKSCQWLNQVTNDDGLVGYQARLDYLNGPDTLTGAGLTAYLLIDSRSDFKGGLDAIKERMDGLVSKQVAYLKDRAVVKSRSVGETDLSYWYWASSAMISVQDWMQFNEALKKAILKNQAQDGRWNLEDKWSVHGGELLTTSMAILALQVYYR
jgi:hypothetical protein